MNFSVQPIRQIASNLLWTPQGVVCNPLLTVSEQGRVLCVATCDAPDRQPFVEFYAGILIPSFPADYAVVFEQMRSQSDIPLWELLSRLSEAKVPTLVVISGVDYDTMRLTTASCIRKIG